MLRIPTIPHRPKLGQTRSFHGLEVLAARKRVLGEVDPATLEQHLLVQGVDEGLRVVSNRNVERKGDARSRKRQKARALSAKILDDAQERRAPARREDLENTPRRASSGLTG